MLACAGSCVYLEPIKNGRRLVLIYKITTANKHLCTASSSLQDLKNGNGRASGKDRLHSQAVSIWPKSSSWVHIVQMLHPPQDLHGYLVH